MASIFKRGRYEPIPKEATIVEEGQRAIAYWTDASGKVRRAALSARQDHIKLPPCKDDPYYITFED